MAEHNKGEDACRGKLKAPTVPKALLALRANPAAIEAPGDISR
jgi:hypothetical protein